MLSCFADSTLYLKFPHFRISPEFSLELYQILKTCLYYRDMYCTCLCPTSMLSTVEVKTCFLDTGLCRYYHPSTWYCVSVYIYGVVAVFELDKPSWPQQGTRPPGIMYLYASMGCCGTGALLASLATTRYQTTWYYVSVWICRVLRYWSLISRPDHNKGLDHLVLCICMHLLGVVVLELD